MKNKKQSNVDVEILFFIVCTKLEVKSSLPKYKKPNKVQQKHETEVRDSQCTRSSALIVDREKVRGHRSTVVTCKAGISLRSALFIRTLSSLKKYTTLGIAQNNPLYYNH